MSKDTARAYLTEVEQLQEHLERLYATGVAPLAGVTTTASTSTVRSLLWLSLQELNAAAQILDEALDSTQQQADQYTYGTDQ